MTLEIHTKKAFDEFTLDVNLTIRDGEFFCIAGPSGSGKSTLLNILSGLLECGGARIIANGKDLSSLPPQERDIGYVFQNKFIFPHMDVLGNVAFGVNARKMPMEHAHEAIRMVNLQGLEHRFPHSLSGGELQRVAIARAIAYKPKILLFDEPLKELDANVKKKIVRELRALHRSLGCTTIYVTHDLEEAFLIADRIAVFNNGKVEQVGTIREIFSKPANDFVKGFVSPYRIMKIDGVDSLVEVR